MPINSPHIPQFRGAFARLPVPTWKAMVFLAAALLALLAPHARGQWERFPVSPARAGGTYADASATLSPSAGEPSLAFARSNSAALQALINAGGGAASVVEFTRAGDYYFADAVGDGYGVLLRSNLTLLVRPGVRLVRHSGFSSAVAGYGSIFRTIETAPTTRLYLGGGGEIGRNLASGPDDKHTVSLVNVRDLTVENLTFFSIGNGGKFALHVVDCERGRFVGLNFKGDQGPYGESHKSDGLHLNGYQREIDIDITGSTTDNLLGVVGFEGPAYSSYWKPTYRQGSMTGVRVHNIRFTDCAQPFRLAGSPWCDAGQFIGSWTESTSTLTSTAAFTNAAVGDYVVMLAGTSMVAGAYPILTKVSNDAVTIAVGAGTADSANAYFGVSTLGSLTWTAATKRLTTTGGKFATVLLQRGDTINIVSGTGVTTGEAVVARSIDNNTIELQTSIKGSDASDVRAAQVFTRYEVVIDNAEGTLDANQTGPATIDDAGIAGGRYFFTLNRLRLHNGTAGYHGVLLSGTGLTRAVVRDVVVPNGVPAVKVSEGIPAIKELIFDSVRKDTETGSQHLLYISSPADKVSISDCSLATQTGSTASFCILDAATGAVTTFPRLTGANNTFRMGGTSGYFINQGGFGLAIVTSGHFTGTVLDGASGLAYAPNSSGAAVNLRSRYTFDGLSIQNTTATLLSGQVDTHISNWLRTSSGAFGWIGVSTNPGSASASSVSFAPEWVTFTIGPADVDGLTTVGANNLNLSTVTRFGNYTKATRGLNCLAVRFDVWQAFSGGGITSLVCSAGTSASGAQFGGSRDLLTTGTTTIYPSAANSIVGSFAQDHDLNLNITSATAAPSAGTQGNLTVSFFLGGAIGGNP